MQESLLSIADSKFGCRYENGSWWLTYLPNNCEVSALLNQEITTDHELRVYTFELRRIYQLADNINIVGFAFIEGIPTTNVVPSSL